MKPKLEKPSFEYTVEALIRATTEMPIFLVSFLAMWLVSWIWMLLAIVVALVTCWRVALPPVSPAMCRILRLPKQVCLENLEQK